MSETENPLDESTPEDSVLVTDGAETPEAETPSEGVDDAPVEEVTEDDREAADSAPDPAPADVGRHARHDSNLTSRQRRQNRQRGR